MTKNDFVNWNDPAARGRLIERVGIDEYNRLMREHIKQSTVETVNGYPIRTVGTRFGRLYAVDGTGQAAATLEGAREIARNSPAKEEST